jgi:hypothetical protein
MTRSDERLEPDPRMVADLYAQALRQGRHVKLRVAGTSMLPAIWPGDTLTVAPLSQSLPAIGEVALQLFDSHLCAHRVVRHIELGCVAGVVTQGDALDAEDPLGGELLGTVVARNARPCRLSTRKADLVLQRLVSICLSKNIFLAAAIRMRKLAVTFLHP